MRGFSFVVQVDLLPLNGATGSKTMLKTKLLAVFINFYRIHIVLAQSWSNAVVSVMPVILPDFAVVKA